MTTTQMVSDETNARDELRLPLMLSHIRKALSAHWWQMICGSIKPEPAPLRVLFFDAALGDRIYRVRISDITPDKE